LRQGHISASGPGDSPGWAEKCLSAREDIVAEDVAHAAECTQIGESSMTQRFAVVTGASTGIGYTTVETLTNADFHVFAGVRTEADAERLRTAFTGSCTPLVFDITDSEAVSRAAATVAERLGKGTLAGLVNNAGIAVSGPLMLLPLDDIRRQIEVNVIGQIAVCQAFGPLLGTDEARQGLPGRIVMMSSVSGQIAAPFMGPYAASKFALEAVSDSLRRELIIFGIDVIVIGPGAIATPIWSKASTNRDLTAGTPYEGYARAFGQHAMEMAKNALPPERVAREVLRALTAAHPPARIAVVPNRMSNWLARAVLPKRFIDRQIAKRFSVTPKT
jgi:NAD(P)-dependent dehydrogenase (short-subunit alcohol dehydrogenase family)